MIEMIVMTTMTHAERAPTASFPHPEKEGARNTKPRTKAGLGAGWSGGLGDESQTRAGSTTGQWSGGGNLEVEQRLRCSIDHLAVDVDAGAAAEHTD